MAVPDLDARGFTLIELLITIAIAAILLSAGLPSFSDFLRNNRVHSAAAGFFSDITAARTEAARTFTNAAVCASTTGASCDGGADWNSGRLVYVDTNGNGSAEASEILHWSAGTNGPTAAASGFSGNRIAFRATGTAVATGSVKLCDERTGDHGRLIEINAAGRIALRQTSCP